MKYRVYHRTFYQYNTVVSSCHNLASLSPGEFDNQIISNEELSISPKPSYMKIYKDSFNNRRTYFSIPEEHDSLEIISRFDVKLKDNNFPHPALTPAWEEVAEISQKPGTPEAVTANEYVYPTSYTEATPLIKDYALKSFKAGRTLLEAATDLMSRMFSDFTFDNTATEVESKPELLMENKKGVCQDFAHFLISCMRAISIPAKYVSGYILTHPPEGEKKLFGIDASHAWVSIYCPFFGWIELDPTNNMLAGHEHIKIAVGRDYHDIPPVKGVFFGNGEHTLDISVDVSKL